MARPDTWTDEEKETLLKLIEQGFSYKEIAPKIGRTVGQISGKIHKMKGYKRSENSRTPGKRHHNNPLMHQNLVEPWADFHRRKKQEREALKAKGEFYIYQSAGRTPGKRK